jgi:hypothetical protein
MQQDGGDGRERAVAAYQLGRTIGADPNALAIRQHHLLLAEPAVCEQKLWIENGAEPFASSN